MSQATRSPGYRQYARDVSRRFLVLAVGLPLGAALVAIVLGTGRSLNLVHLVSGAAWAGATIYLVGVLSPTLLELDPPDRAQVTVPLIPKHVLVFSALAVATLVTGPSLTAAIGRDHGAPVVVAAYLVGVALLVAAGYLIRLQNRIYGEVHGAEPDMARVGALAARLGRAGMVAAVLQVLTLIVMAFVRFA